MGLYRLEVSPRASVRKTQGAASSLFPKRYRDWFREVLEPLRGKKYGGYIWIIIKIYTVFSKVIPIDSSPCCCIHDIF
jgi:hypothetical protein